MSDKKVPNVKLYYVKAETESGDNADLLVYAATPEQAKEFWSAFCDENEWDVSDEPSSVKEVPAPASPEGGVISWDLLTDD